MHRSFRTPRQSGFSLIELLVTALIFGIGLLGLAALQVSTLRANSGGRNRISAASLAEACLSAAQGEGSLSWSYAAGVMGASAVYPAASRIYTGGAATGTFGYFDVNGQQVLAADPTLVFTVDWVRLNPTAATPKAAITKMNMNEFVVTVHWTDQVKDASGAVIASTALPTLSMSRLIRY